MKQHRLLYESVRDGALRDFLSHFPQVELTASRHFREGG